MVEPCPICLWSNADVQATSRRVQIIHCPRCGDFEITTDAVHATTGLDIHWRLRLSAWIRRTPRSTDGELLVNLEDLQRVQRDWRSLAVSEKLDALLTALADRSKYPGAGVYVEPQRDLVWGWCDDVEEFSFQLRALKERDLAYTTGGPDEWSITPKGWDRIDALRYNLTPDNNLVFVAMTFDQALTVAWTDGLRPGLEDAGYRPERVDSTEHNGKIDDRILAKVRESQFVVVDVTTQNRGAYFEAGFALGLSRQVIWSVREEELKEVHFDTRQFNHIVWTDPPDLRMKIKNRVLGVFGRGRFSQGK